MDKTHQATMLLAMKEQGILSLEILTQSMPHMNVTCVLWYSSFFSSRPFPNFGPRHIL